MLDNFPSGWKTFLIWSRFTAELFGKTQEHSYLKKKGGWGSGNVFHN